MTWQRYNKNLRKSALLAEHFSFWTDLTVFFPLLCQGTGTLTYATEGLSQNLFVSKYRLQLPSEDDIKQYLLENIPEEKFKELKEEECDQ